MSLGGGGPFTSNCDSSEVARKTAIDALIDEEIATVIAAGNEGFAEGVGTPACISTAVTVGSTTDPGDAVASTSNRGALLDLFAPGVSISSSVPNNTYANFNGTSMATPHVAGAWAVLREAFPAESVAQILSRLQATGVPITNGTTNSVTPRIDLLAAHDAQWPGCWPRCLREHDADHGPSRRHRPGQRDSVSVVNSGVRGERHGYRRECLDLWPRPHVSRRCRRPARRARWDH